MGDNLGGHWSGGVPAAATAVVKQVESFSAIPYADNPNNPNNTWTIGYGSIRDSSGQPVTPHSQAVTPDQAEALLMRDMATGASDVQVLVTVPLSICEASALISFTYNEGRGSLQTSTLLGQLNAGNKADIPNQLRRWIYQGPEQLLGLLRRRWAEAAIFVGVDPVVAGQRGWSEIEVLTDWPSFGV